MTEESGERIDGVEPAAGVETDAAAEMSERAEPDPVVAPDEPIAPAPPSIPRALEIVTTGLDLNVAASRSIRQASLYAGAMFLLLLGPAAIVVALAIAQSDFTISAAPTPDEIRALGRAFAPAWAALLLGAMGLTAVTIDLQLIAIALIDARFTGRVLTLRDALAIARRSFWRLVRAGFLTGILTVIPLLAVEPLLGISSRGQSADARFVVQSVLGLLVALPFAYVGASVAVGGAGALDAIRWSIRLGRRRGRLALVIGLVNTATGLLSTFAIGAAAEVLVRIADALDIDRATGLVQIVWIVVLAAAAIAAIGSLTTVIAALTASPQVVAYRRLGGPIAAAPTYARAAPSGTGSWANPTVEAAPPKPAAYIPRGMWLVIGLLILIAFAAIVRAM